MRSAVGENALLLGPDRAAVPVEVDFAPVRDEVGSAAVEHRSIVAPATLAVRVGMGSRLVAVVSDFALAHAGVAQSVAAVKLFQILPELEVPLLSSWRLAGCGAGPSSKKKHMDKPTTARRK